MQVHETEIAGVKYIVPDVFADARGHFLETFNDARYREAGIAAAFVQDNESFSRKGVVRGLHWQASSHAQAKLVRAVTGAVWDVAVDIRKGSPTFGRHVAKILFGPGSQYAAAHPEQPPACQLFIPRGFAHGFVVLEDNTLFGYKCDNLRCAAAERGLMFSDPRLGLEWPELDVPVLLSERDRRHPCLDAIEPWEEARP
ncbi:MAG: dTDP-4-dehydrorhamnose 3,5-epimerase [Kiritimatiellia bacterium]